MYFNFLKLKCFPPHKELYPQVFNKMTTSNQKQSSSQRQRRVNREHKKKNKNRAGFSHRDDERYSVEYNSSDHWGEIEESVPYEPGCYELDKHVVYSECPYTQLYWDNGPDCVYGIGTKPAGVRLGFGPVFSRKNSIGTTVQIA